MNQPFTIERIEAAFGVKKMETLGICDNEGRVECWTFSGLNKARLTYGYDSTEDNPHSFIYSEKGKRTYLCRVISNTGLVVGENVAIISCLLKSLFKLGCNIPNLSAHEKMECMQEMPRHLAPQSWFLPCPL